MIILAKKLTTLVSAQDTKESEWDLEQFCQTCEKSLSWRGKDSAARTWKARLKRVFWMKHLFTQTLKPSLTESFEDSWISYLEDSRANHSLKQALEKLPKTQDTFSPTSQKESKSANLELFSSKMSKGYSVAKQEKENLWSNMSEEHWKKWVTEQRSEYSQRVKSERHIKEKESSSWDTPRVGGVDESWQTAEKRGRTSNLYAQMDKVCTEKNWPTARTSDAEGGRIETEMTEVGFQSKRHKSNQTFGAKLRDAVETHEENWATPRAGAIDNSRPNNKGGIPLGDQVKRNWATPQAFDAVNLVRSPEKLAQTRREKNAGCMNLREQVHYPTMTHSRKDYPTPTTRDWKGAYPKASQEKNPRHLLPDVAGENTLQDLMKNNTDGKPQGLLKLNPDWVENLMGIPQGWTDLEH